MVRKFTLIELLVVVAILAILLALLMPALRTARMKAEEAVCVGNLKSNGVATMIYASDHNGLAPTGLDPIAKVPTYHWSNYLHNGDYLKFSDASFCPSLWPYKLSNVPSTTQYPWYTYGMKRARPTPTTYWQRGSSYNILLTETEAGGFDPTNFLLFADSIRVDTDPQRQSNALYSDIDFSYLWRMDLRHAGRGMAWFADGSVRANRTSELVSDYGFTSPNIYEH